jgi:hypothetical protein
MTKQEKLKKEREPYKIKLRVFCQCNFIKLRRVAADLGITEQELYNMLNGFQEKVGCMDFQDFWNKIIMMYGEELKVV